MYFIRACVEIISEFALPLKCRLQSKRVREMSLNRPFSSRVSAKYFNVSAIFVQHPDMPSPEFSDRPPTELRGWFTTTHWSVVLAASGSESHDATEALETLCRTLKARQMLLKQEHATAIGSHGFIHAIPIEETVIEDRHHRLFPRHVELVFFGRVAERYRRNMSFLLGVGLFTLSSAACAAADSVVTLTAFRLVQAAGAALMTPTSLGLLLAAFPPERRDGAVRTWTAIGGLAAALGPVIGGVLVTVNWRWIFLVNVPIGLVAMLVGWWKLPEVPGHEAPRPHPFDALLVTGGIGALTFAIVKVNDWGWRSPGIGISFIAAIVLLAWFVWRCLRSDSPFVVSHPPIHRRRTGDGALLRRLRRHAAFCRIVGADGVGMVGAEDRARDRAGAAAGPDHVAAFFRQADCPFWRGGRRHRRHLLLRGRALLLGQRDRA